MEKVLRTTYRKLWQMCSRVDQNLALRSALVCGPSVMYDHTSNEWIRIDESQLRPMPEAEHYLDILVRRLNNGRQYFIPPAASELEAIKLRYNVMSRGKSNFRKSHYEKDSDSNVNTTNKNIDKANTGDKATQSKESSNSTIRNANTNSRTEEMRSRTFDATNKKTSESKSNDNRKGMHSPVLPPSILPYSKLHETLRYLFDTTPFSVGKLNDAFAAVKLLSYVCTSVDKAQSTVLEAPEYLRKLPVPQLQRLEEPVAMDGIYLKEGLTPELRRTVQTMEAALREHKAFVAKKIVSVDLTEEENSNDNEDNKDDNDNNNVISDKVMSTIKANKTSHVTAESTSGESEGKIKEKEEKEVKEEEVSAQSTESTTRNKRDESSSAATKLTKEFSTKSSEDVQKEEHDTSSEKGTTSNNTSSASASEDTANHKAASTSTREEPLRSDKSLRYKRFLEENKQAFGAPSKVQLLLAHPMLHGFFWRTVQLVVSNDEKKAAAFVINRPLMNDKGVLATVGSVVRYSRAHPIFARHLSKHTIMVGGPVMICGSVYESIFLLHRVPDIPEAFPLADHLWLDGDLNALMNKLENHEASAEDVVVLCGFAGWSKNQLKGEVATGTWIVAASETDDKNVDSFIFNIARAAGAFTFRHSRAKHSSSSKEKNHDVNKTCVNKMNEQANKPITTTTSSTSSSSLESSTISSQSESMKDGKEEEEEEQMRSSNNSSVKVKTKSQEECDVSEHTSSSISNRNREDANNSDKMPSASNNNNESDNNNANKAFVEHTSDTQPSHSNEAEETNDKRSSNNINSDNSETSRKTDEGCTAQVSNATCESKTKETNADINSNDSYDIKNDRSDNNSDNDEMKDNDSYDEAHPLQAGEEPTYISGIKNRWNWVNRHVTYAWVWTLETLGESYADLSKNQRHEIKDEPFDEENE